MKEPYYAEMIKREEEKKAIRKRFAKELEERLISKIKSEPKEKKKKIK